jgi:hypothetical protein
MELLQYSTAWVHKPLNNFIKIENSKITSGQLFNLHPLESKKYYKNINDHMIKICQTMDWNDIFNLVSIFYTFSISPRGQLYYNNQKMCNYDYAYHLSKKAIEYVVNRYLAYEYPLEEATMQYMRNTILIKSKSVLYFEYILEYIKTNTAKTLFLHYMIQEETVKILKKNHSTNITYFLKRLVYCDNEYITREELYKAYLEWCGLLDISKILNRTDFTVRVDKYIKSINSAKTKIGFFSASNKTRVTRKSFNGWLNAQLI